MVEQHTGLHQDAFVFEDLLHHVGLALSYGSDVGYLPAFLVEPEDLALEDFFAVDMCRFLHSCELLVCTSRSRLLMLTIIITQCVFSFSFRRHRWPHWPVCWPEAVFVV